MTTYSKHVTPDDGHTIQMSVHAIAKMWFDQGYCTDCIAREILFGASAVAMDCAGWKNEKIADAVDLLFTPDAKHLYHREQ